MFDKIICVEKGTIVSLLNGEKKAIEKIECGDKALSYNFKKNKIEITFVEKIVRSFHDKIAKVSFNHKRKIGITDDHPIWVVERGWCSLNPEKTMSNYNLSVKHLLTNDKCLVYDNDTLKISEIESIRWVEGLYEMYDISGGKNNCFFANGILVHDENIMRLPESLLALRNMKTRTMSKVY